VGHFGLLFASVYWELPLPCAEYDFLLLCKKMTGTKADGGAKKRTPADPSSIVDADSIAVQNTNVTFRAW
jgi:hypothetical protein